MRTVTFEYSPRIGVFFLRFQHASVKLIVSNINDIAGSYLRLTRWCYHDLDAVVSTYYRKFMLLSRRERSSVVGYTIYFVFILDVGFHSMQWPSSYL